MQAIDMSLCDGGHNVDEGPVPRRVEIKGLAADTVELFLNHDLDWCGTRFCDGQPERCPNGSRGGDVTAICCGL
jgi:hypothetical protein